MIELVPLTTAAIFLAQRPRYGYPEIPPQEAQQNPCYMITAEGAGLDLTRLCQRPAQPSTQPIAPSELPQILAPSGSGNTSTGRCVYPTDLAADGSRCGDRAETRRRGGR